jgi:hypothetical protein
MLYGTLLGSRTLLEQAVGVAPLGHRPLLNGSLVAYTIMQNNVEKETIKPNSKQIIMMKFPVLRLRPKILMTLRVLPYYKASQKFK